MQVVVSKNENPSKLKQVPDTTNVAIFATYTSNEQAIEDVCFYIENNLSDIIQLPELFFTSDKSVTKQEENRTHIEQLSRYAIEEISAVLRDFQYVCTSLILDGIHQAVLISNVGIYATQKQIQVCERYEWTPQSDTLNVVDIALEQGNINAVLLTADDALMPHIIQTAVDHYAHVLLVPFDIQAPKILENVLIEKASQFRVCAVAATREKSFPNTRGQTQQSNGDNNQNTKMKTLKSAGFIINIPSEANINSLLKARHFSGDPRQPIVKAQHGKITKSLIHPKATCIKNIE